LKLVVTTPVSYDNKTTIDNISMNKFYIFEKFFEATNKKIFKILVCKFKMFLYFAFSIGIEMDFTAVYYLLISTLIFMTTKVNNMTTTINMTNVLCVMGCGAQLESPTIPIARNEFISILSRNKRSAWEGNLPLSTI
jgi:hypothetical protein